MYTIIYFETRRKEVPVLNFLDKLNAKAQTKILKQISLLSQGFIKKSGKVPKAEIERAITYKLEFGRRFK